MTLSPDGECDLGGRDMRAGSHETDGDGCVAR
jgi:hypothetical protein